MLQTTYHVQRTRTARESMSFRIRPKAPESLPVEFAEWTPPDAITSADWEAAEVYGPPERPVQTARIVARRDELLKAVKSAARFCNPKSLKPAQQCLRVSVNGTADVSGTTNEHAGTVRLDCEHAGEMEFLVKPSELAKILTKVKSDDCILSARLEPRESEAVVTLETGAAEFTLATEDVSEFPPLPEFSPVWAMSVDVSEFRRVLSETVPFTDQESTRYALGAVQFEFHRERIICAATDGRRLSVSDCDAQTHGNPPEALSDREAGAYQEFGFCRALVPAGVLTHVLRDLPKAGATVALSVSDDGIFVALQCGAMSVVTRQQDGRFPGWRDIVPKECNHVTTVDCAALAEAVELVELATDCELTWTEFEFPASAGIAMKSANGKARCKVVAQHAISGEAVDGITLNGKYILDQLRLCGSGPIELRLRDDSSPVTIRNPHGRQFYILMPLERKPKR